MIRVVAEMTGQNHEILDPEGETTVTIETTAMTAMTETIPERTEMVTRKKMGMQRALQAKETEGIKREGITKKNSLMLIQKSLTTRTPHPVQNKKIAQKSRAD
jgi:hypothetical protein